MSTHGRVPMFRMRPHKGTLITAMAVLVLGVAYFFDSRRDPGNLSAHKHANLALVVAIIVSGLLFIIATGRMWFRHLWHDRYR